MNKLLLFFLGITFLSNHSLYAQYEELTKDKDIGFKQILIKENIKEWHGNPDYWRFEEGVLVGEVTEEQPLEGSTFFVWEKRVKDFELKVEYRISSEGNSGIYYRSKTEDGSVQVLRGYQADIDGANKYSGIVYENFENRGHEILANRGQVIYVKKDDVPVEIGSIGEEEELVSKISKEGWNKYHLVVRGNTIIQILNCQVMSMIIDDYKKRAKEGILGVQLHQGPAMKVEYKNFRLKRFSD